MGITLGQQYDIGEKPTVILYTYINRQAGTPEKQRKQKHCSTSSNMVVIVVVVVVLFTLTDRIPTIPSNIRGCQSGTGFAGQKISEEHLPVQSSDESKRKHNETKQNRNDLQPLFPPKPFD